MVSCLQSGQYKEQTSQDKSTDIITIKPAKALIIIYSWIQQPSHFAKKTYMKCLNNHVNTKKIWNLQAIFVPPAEKIKLIHESSLSFSSYGYISVLVTGLILLHKHIQRITPLHSLQ